jgi:hypothetical protein
MNGEYSARMLFRLSPIRAVFRGFTKKMAAFPAA